MRQQVATETGTSDGRTLEGAGLPWQDWLRRNFPHVTTAPFGARHLRLWEWFEALTPGEKPRARVEIWPRGGAKSSTVELAVTRLGVKLSRRFVLYVSGTQEQADAHVQTIGSLFERLGVGRALNVYGHSKGWRRNQLRTENGFNVAAFGLDASTRGMKLDEFRPDLIVLDDIDQRHDSEETTRKKRETITTTLLPAGSADCAVVFVQNKIHRNSLAAQLADGRADFLHDREPVCEEPAVRELRVDHDPNRQPPFLVVGGEPTWEGQSLLTCQKQINEWGYAAFRREAQHEVEDEEGGLWTRELIEATRWNGPLPDFFRIAVAIDPNTTKGGDEAGIVVAGAFRQDGQVHGMILEDATVPGGPEAWAPAAVQAYARRNADVLVAEQNNGGEMVAITIKTVPGAPAVKLLHASRGKVTRAEPVQMLYAEGRVHHAGQFPLLETEQCTYKPHSGMPSPGRMDALVWVLTELMLDGLGAPQPIAVAGPSRRRSHFGNWS